MDSKTRPNESDPTIMERDTMTRDETEEHQEDLGDVEPKVDTKEDQLIQSQIQGNFIIKNKLSL